MAQRTIETYKNGQLTGTTTVTVPDGDVNADTLRDRAAQAIAANQTFLGLASPTNPQTVAQVQRLTRECTALIRLMLGLLDDTTGT